MNASYIEPCCMEKQLSGWLDFLKENRRHSATFFSNSDWDLASLLEFFASRVPGGELTLCLVSVEQNTLETLRKLLERTYVDVGTRKSLPLLSRLTLVTQGNDRKAVYDALRGADERLRIAEDRIGFRCLACANDHAWYVLQGSLNQHRMNSTQMFALMTGETLYGETMRVLAAKARVNEITDWKAAYRRVLLNEGDWE